MWGARLYKEADVPRTRNIRYDEVAFINNKRTLFVFEGRLSFA
jgi:hypothetical protein